MGQWVIHGIYWKSVERNSFLKSLFLENDLVLVCLMKIMCPKPLGMNYAEYAILPWGQVH